MRTSEVRNCDPGGPIVSIQTEQDQLAEELGSDSRLGRRSVLKGACAVCVGAVGVGVLAACGGNTPVDDSDGAGDGGGAAGNSGGGSAAGGSKTYHAADIPVGGGKVFGADNTVITQPKAGEFKAFSATCTHQGFLVGNVQGGTINCFHHGSKYDQTTGKNVAGPAPSPLPSKTISASGGTLTVT
jgi:Rieske Fe-S protein